MKSVSWDIPIVNRGYLHGLYKKENISVNNQSLNAVKCVESLLLCKLKQNRRRTKQMRFYSLVLGVKIHQCDWNYWNKITRGFYKHIKLAMLATFVMSYFTVFSFICSKNMLVNVKLEIRGGGVEDYTSLIHNLIDKLNGTAKTKLVMLAVLYCGEFMGNSVGICCKMLHVISCISVY